MSISQYLHLLAARLTPSLFLIILAQLRRSLRVGHHNLAEVTILSQQIGCRFMSHLSPRYNPGRGRGAAATVITQNCWAGRTDVWIRLRWHRVCVCDIVCVWFNAKQPSSFSGLVRSKASCRRGEAGFGHGRTDFHLWTSFRAICWVLVQRPAWIWHAAET